MFSNATTDAVSCFLIQNQTPCIPNCGTSRLKLDEKEMAGNNEDEMESLLHSFDQIYEDVKGGITELQSLKSTYDAEIKRREALEFSCTNLKTENERLLKIYTESFSKIADQMERRSMCQSLIEELKKVKEVHLNKEEEHRKEMELLKQEYATEIGDLKVQVRCFLHQQSAKEELINQLHNELDARKNHIDALNRRLEQIHADIEMKHYQEIQGLKDWLVFEQEEKNELNKKLLSVENELINNRKKLEEQQRDMSSNRHNETLKQRILKLRKENETLKRQLQDLKER